ncbi:hypothetical protein [Rhizobium laguerreae]|uniref:hypothetical protein n=1 Tax=Rhizobium laguerreae TaxID=1076926 RepID=UPI001C90C46D|nr:hypothetical protein [Rhizobium laguerreae]MBY3314688.1 hypothetical protein [Rhizobium laguerreae]
MKKLLLILSLVSVASAANAGAGFDEAFGLVVKRWSFIEAMKNMCQVRDPYQTQRVEEAIANLPNLSELKAQMHDAREKAIIETGGPCGSDVRAMLTKHEGLLDGDLEILQAAIESDFGQ